MSTPIFVISPSWKTLLLAGNCLPLSEEFGKSSQKPGARSSFEWKARPGGSKTVSHKKCQFARVNVNKADDDLLASVIRFARPIVRASLTF